MSLKTQDKLEKEILDTEEFFERVQRDQKLLINVLDTFIKDFKQKRAKVKLALKKRDFAALASLMHSLKGACANISARALQESCLLMEEAALKNHFSSIQKELSNWDHGFKELLKCITKFKTQFK